MARALIIGLGSFVGRYLAEHLQQCGDDVHGSVHQQRPDSPFPCHQLDVGDAAAVQALVAQLKPEHIYHLAGITRPALGDNMAFYRVNMLGSLHVLEAAQAQGCRLLLVSSAYVYGRADSALRETMPLAPVNAYGASKAAADIAAISYALSGLEVIRVRPFNHSGPGQSPDFVLPSLVTQVARIEAGQAPPQLKLGNLESVRDFSDVRDVVRAYRLLMAHGQSGEAYNVASGRGVSIRQLAEMVMAASRLPLRLEVEASRQRPQDIPYLLGDIHKLQQATGWQQDYRLEQTLEDMLTYARAQQSKP